MTMFFDNNLGCQSSSEIEALFHVTYLHQNGICEMFTVSLLLQKVTESLSGH